MLEIAREGEAEHQAEPDRHVRIAGEVEIDLDRVGEEPEPGLGQGTELGWSKASSAIGATSSAISTFCARPMMKMRAPAEARPSVERRASSCRATVL